MLAKSAGAPPRPALQGGLHLPPCYATGSIPWPSAESDQKT